MNTESFLLEQKEDKKMGMWFFIAAEVVIFASLFGVYLTLRSHTDGGPSPNEMLELKGVMVSTVLLLSSSFTIYIASHASEAKQAGKASVFLLLTLVLAGAFLIMEGREFLHYYEKGYEMQNSSFLSAFYLLVGTHGAHVAAGCIWMALLLIHLKLKGQTEQLQSKIAVFSLYWHFVDLVWVLIFTLVYLYGKVG
ncbi:cytochrome c oxidase subunit 3 [[Bacillus] enclensis]|uniref:cytochrome c oxidase subunit 3 n=1 Tax=[Bacillus] enclensis TaxID=1402860 RepID=UPI0018DD1161|nr:cytochrome c oxidase subunit 3 [[Bacillus] enclensis]MBH9967267.1 cytochrome c oxidase subunit 3 [[Bacillus] enclensis]